MYIILFSAYSDASSSMIGAFILGVLADVWRGNTLGYSSLSYTAVAFAIQLYKRKFNPQAPGFLISAGLFTFTLSELVASGGTTLSWKRILDASVVAFTIIVLWFIVLKLWVHPSEKGKILR